MMPLHNQTAILHRPLVDLYPPGYNPDPQPAQALPIRHSNPVLRLHQQQRVSPEEAKLGSTVKLSVQEG